jgi:hypothetical protein
MKNPRKVADIAYALQFLADYDVAHLDEFSRELLGGEPALPVEQLAVVREVLIALYEALAAPSPQRWERVLRAHHALTGPLEATARATAAAAAASPSPWANTPAPAPLAPTPPMAPAPRAPAPARATAAMRVVEPSVTPFAGARAAPPVAVASSLEPHPELGGTAPLASLHDGKATPHAAAGAQRVVVAGVSLRLDAYARVCALQAADPVAASHLWLELGVVDDALRRELDACWREKLAGSAELSEAWRTLYVQFAAVHAST